MADLKTDDRIEWNPTGDTWLPGVVASLLRSDTSIVILLDDGERLTVEKRHVRPVAPPASTPDTREAELLRSAPDTDEHPWHHQTCRRCNVLAKYCPCEHPDVAPDTATRDAVMQWLWTANEQWARGKQTAAIEGPCWEDDTDTHEYWRSLADTLISRGYIRQAISEQQIRAAVFASRSCRPKYIPGTDAAHERMRAAFRAAGIKVSDD